MSLFEPLFDALNRAGVRYVVIGGLATALHGHAQLTADVDLIVEEIILRHREVRMPGDERGETPRDEWGVGWEAHRVHQLTLALNATPAQRLEWLEEIIFLAYRVGALSKRRD